MVAVAQRLSDRQQESTATGVNADVRRFLFQTLLASGPFVLSEPSRTRVVFCRPLPDLATNRGFATSCVVPVAVAEAVRHVSTAKGFKDTQIVYLYLQL